MIWNIYRPLHWPTKRKGAAARRGERGRRTRCAESAMRSAESVTAHQACLLLPDPVKLAHRAMPHTARDVCGIGIVNYPVRVHTAAFYANEYLDFYIKDRIVWFNPFEP